MKSCVAGRILANSGRFIRHCDAGHFADLLLIGKHYTYASHQKRAKSTAMHFHEAGIRALKSRRTGHRIPGAPS
jgi:hypothetical protein